jgi:hypothetical protein
LYFVTHAFMAGVSRAALYISGLMPSRASSPMRGRADSSNVTAPPMRGRRPLRPASSYCLGKRSWAAATARAKTASESRRICER